ncbi:catalase family peroxidase [Hyphomicrobium sp.]|uniref:catalase family peroxidase n=1 Tax=Hyphomicrobium sp. TaxID=82 RepID=UPI0035698A4C
MPDTPRAPPYGSLALIAIIIGASAATFAYTAGWFSPKCLTPDKLVAAFAPPGGPALGHRRNHAKGICFTGMFESNGAGAEVSKAAVFAQGQYPVLGRFNLGTPNPDVEDATVRVRGLGLQFKTPDGQVWRSAMINAPFFPVSTPQAFYGLLEVSKSKEPDAMKKFIAANPEFGNFAAWAGSAPWTGSYAEEPYNSLNSFVMTGKDGVQHTVRWSLLPEAQAVPVSQDELKKRDPNFLEEDITKRVASAPQHWKLMLTMADPNDPTADPSKEWPADRRKIEAGTLTVEKIEQERDGPCRDINFDPTILPTGITTSDDPFPAARSAAYAKSYDLRTAEAKDYPHTAPGDKQ